MATSDTEIANQALFRAGATKKLGDLATDKSPEADFFRTLLPQLRDELLEQYRWKFATRRAALAMVAGVTRTDWAYVYAAPVDLLTAQAVVQPGVRNPRPEDEVPFDLEAGDVDPNAPADSPYGAEPAGTVLLTDQASAELIYTARCSNPVRFSALFTGALSWRLAIDAALFLTKKADLAQRAQAGFDATILQAKSHQARQRRLDPASAPDFLDGYETTQPRFKTALE